MSYVWTSTPTWSAMKGIDYITLNQLIGNSSGVFGNLDYLYNMLVVQPVKVSNSGTYTTTSASYVDVDATNLKITITPTSGKVFVIAGFNVSISGGSGMGFDLILDSTTRLGATTLGLATSVGGHIVVFGVFSGLSNASHTFKLQWVQQGGATLSMVTDPSIVMDGWAVN